MICHKIGEALENIKVVYSLNPFLKMGINVSITHKNHKNNVIGFVEV